MSVTAEKISKQRASLQKKIDSLSGDYLTNTWKRQQEQKWRDTQKERYRLQKQVLDYLEEESACRELSALEAALITGAFYEELRGMLTQKEYLERRIRSNTYIFPQKDSASAKRLSKAGIVDTAGLLSAITAFEALIGKATIPPDPKAVRIRDLTFKARLRQGGDIQFTPENIVRQMIELAGVDSSSNVLEPSAGIGNIADALKQITAQVDCIEPAHEFSELLRLKGHRVIGRDLLEYYPAPIYDAVLMNPPFSDECRHIRHAYSLLKPGGMLVSVCSVNVNGTGNRKYAAFLEWLSMQRRSIQDVADKFEMTGTRVQILTIEKGELGHVPA